MEIDINHFWQQLHERSKQRLNLFDQYRETHNSLQQEEVDGTWHLLQTQNKRVEVEELQTIVYSLKKFVAFKKYCHT